MTVHHATGISSLAPSLLELSGRYRYRGLPGWAPNHPAYRGLRAIPVPGEEEPPEEEPEVPEAIVARLHKEIAAKSPEHAALVTEYEALPVRRRPRYTPPHPRPATRERMGGYAQLRASGLGKKAAARQARISARTASRYEADFLAKTEVTG